MSKVEPIRNTKKIADIKKLLANNKRDHCLFICGINNGLRAGDLSKLKVEQVRYLKPGSEIQIREEKTGKLNSFFVNKSVHKAIQDNIKESQLTEDDYLFPSRKGKGRMKTWTINRLVKEWTRSVGLRGNYGSHSLRKTFGYQQRTKFGTAWEILAKRFKHSNMKVTQNYLGISDDEVRNICMNEI